MMETTMLQGFLIMNNKSKKISDTLDKTKNQL